MHMVLSPLALVPKVRQAVRHWLQLHECSGSTCAGRSGEQDTLGKLPTQPRKPADCREIQSQAVQTSSRTMQQKGGCGEMWLSKHTAHG